MTIEKELKSRVEGRGMFSNQAEQVIARTKVKCPEMKDRWNDECKGYPEALLRILWITTCSEAVKWIDENLPKAWYRPLFAEVAGVE